MFKHGLFFCEGHNMQKVGYERLAVYNPDRLNYRKSLVEPTFTSFETKLWQPKED